MAASYSRIWHRVTVNFLVTKEFEIYSKAAGEDGIYAKVTSRRKNGYVQVAKSDKLKYQGTEIHIVIPRNFNLVLKLQRILIII